MIKALFPLDQGFLDPDPHPGGRICGKHTLVNCILERRFDGGEIDVAHRDVGFLPQERILPADNIGSADWPQIIVAEIGGKRIDNRCPPFQGRGSKLASLA